jgi:hypothetical protein
MSKHLTKQEARLQRRRKAHEESSVDVQRGATRPGSMNRHKSNSIKGPK